MAGMLEWFANPSSTGPCVVRAIDSFIHSFIHSFNRFIELLKPLWPVKTVIHEGIRKTLESPLDSREIKTVHLKGNQPSIFTGRIDTEAEAPYIGHLM